MSYAIKYTLALLACKNEEYDLVTQLEYCSNLEGILELRGNFILKFWSEDELLNIFHSLLHSLN